MSAAWIAIGALGGLIAGSFLSTLVIRWPEGRTIGGRSACDTCGTELRWYELLPLASLIAQRGRCRACHAPIGMFHPAMEIGCAALGALAMAVAPGIEGVFGALFGWLLLVLAVLDLLYFWLPDRLTAALALVGLGSLAFGVPPSWPDRLIGGAVAWAALALIAVTYRRIRKRDGMGGGDPKLFGAIGLWLGWQALPYVLLGASAAGVGMALVFAARGRAVAGDTRLPFGTLLACAAFPIWLLMR